MDSKENIEEMKMLLLGCVKKFQQLIDGDLTIEMIKNGWFPMLKNSINKVFDDNVFCECCDYTYERYLNKTSNEAEHSGENPFIDKIMG